MRHGGGWAARSWAAAALVLAGCYAGANLDAWVRFPAIGAAVLFPPYAILTAALWRSPPRTWWSFLLAASVGNFLPHRLSGFGVGFVLLAEVVNHLRAVLAAVLLRRFAGHAPRLATLREMIAYLLVAVLAAPGLAGLAGACLTRWQGLGPFWMAWQQWSLSNAITALTLLPLLGLELRRQRPRRLIEAALLTGALLAAGALVFSRVVDRTHTSQIHLYWALPFLLWSAVRFGPRGTSACLLGVTVLSIWGALEGLGPFAATSPTQNLLELQAFLLAASIPTLLLSALIEQQRGTAAELTDSRRQYRSVVEDQTEMICRFRPDGTYTFANGAYRQAFSLAPAELPGGGVWTAVPAGVHRGPRELAGLTPGAPIATREVCVLGPEKEPRWQQWRERGLFDERGAIVEYQAVGRDVTDRRRMEDEGRELEARRSVEAALREADRRKDEFLAVLGHELRNPLAPIGIALELLRQEPAETSEALWARASIGRQLKHLTRLLDDLQDITRITLGKLQLQLEVLDLRKVVMSALEVSRPLIDSCGHEVVVRLPEEPQAVKGDSVRLIQVLCNLLTNAAKYTDRGGRIEVSIEREAPNVRLSVRDNGIGMAPDALARIFEPFSQLPGAREREQSGLGIGLTLARHLVELHAGTVEARSPGPGLGSELVVRLPAGEEALVEPEPPAPPVSRPRPALRILAVDDNTDIAVGLASVLHAWGHTVRTAHDGAAALELASAFAPHVVLVDLGLPHVDGLEVARRLRRGRAPALMVSMSGFGQEETRTRSGQAGFHHHLAKPVDMPSLRVLLDQVAVAETD